MIQHKGCANVGRTMCFSDACEITCIIRLGNSGVRITLSLILQALEPFPAYWLQFAHIVLIYARVIIGLLKPNVLGNVLSLCSEYNLRAGTFPFNTLFYTIL